MPISLQEMRALLLPGLQGICTSNSSWALAPLKAEGAALAFDSVFLPPVSLPVAAAMGAAAVIIKNPTISRRNMFFGRKKVMTPLATVCDTLRPGLWRFDPDFEFDMQVDFAFDNLRVIGLHKPSGRIGEFAVSRKSIIEETYKAEFAPKLRKLVQELKGEEASAPELPVNPVFGRKLDF